MRTLYNELNIGFSIEHIHFYAQNFVFEQFFRSIPCHSHGADSYEIHYIPYGKGQVQINNVRFDVVPNTLYITGPHIEHAQIPCKENPMVEYCIYLKIDSKLTSCKKIKPNSFISLFADTKSWFGTDHQNIHGLMQMIFHELEHKSTGYMVQVETLLKQLIIHIVRNYENKKESKSFFEPSNLTDNKYIIIEECFLYEYQDITLEKLASRLGLSNRQLERHLQTYYGKTFLQKKSEAKMSAASILLADTTNTITDVAISLGYSSVEHFSAAFKRYYHMTAGTYRKSLIPN